MHHKFFVGWAVPGPAGGSYVAFTRLLSRLREKGGKGEVEGRGWNGRLPPYCFIKSPCLRPVSVFERFWRSSELLLLLVYRQYHFLLAVCSNNHSIQQFHFAPFPRYYHIILSMLYVEHYGEQFVCMTGYALWGCILVT